MISGIAMKYSREGQLVGTAESGRANHCQRPCAEGRSHGCAVFGHVPEEPVGRTQPVSWAQAFPRGTAASSEGPASASPLEAACACKGTCPRHRARQPCTRRDGDGDETLLRECGTPPTGPPAAAKKSCEAQRPRALLSSTLPHTGGAGMCSHTCGPLRVWLKGFSTWTPCCTSHLANTVF